MAHSGWAKLSHQWGRCIGSTFVYVRGRFTGRAGQKVKKNLKFFLIWQTPASQRKKSAALNEEGALVVHLFMLGGASQAEQARKWKKISKFFNCKNEFRNAKFIICSLGFWKKMHSFNFIPIFPFSPSQARLFLRLLPCRDKAHTPSSLFLSLALANDELYKINYWELYVVATT